MGSSPILVLIQHTYFLSFIDSYRSIHHEADQQGSYRPRGTLVCHGY